jgi:predicted ABC-class ATPase
MQRLEKILRRIDGRGYKAYKELQRSRFDFGDFELLIDHVQGDPYAAPSRLRARIDLHTADLPPSVLSPGPRRRATRDFLARAFRRASRGSREVAIDAGAQTVLERSACLIDDQAIELRFTLNLPAAGRRILGRQAQRLLSERLPEIVRRSALAANLDLQALLDHAATIEDQVALRAALPAADLVAFIADGARLPRRSGVDDRPLADAVASASPDSLRVTLESPNHGPLTGMGIPRGVTLIVGGGFHGKSTLLRALESGVYDHIPGDGREQVVSDGSAVKIRAEDGRAVSGVDISPFIDHLPHGRSTRSFSTELASGSTSQAAALVEALESGATVVLLDEDTSATNFMIRDRRMQALVAKAEEPITPFIDRIAELYQGFGVSTVLVMGGCGDYFDHADTVLQMDAYLPRDVSARARQIAAEQATGRASEQECALVRPQPRTLDPRSLNPERRPGRTKIQARGLDSLLFGSETIDLRAVEQLVDPSQIRAIGWLLAHLSRSRGPHDPRAVIGDLLQHLEAAEWDELSGRPDGDLALPRLQEVMAALNRLRGARLS